MIETYKIELWCGWESYVLWSLVGVVNVTVLFNNHFTRMVGGFCRGAPFVMYVEQFQRI